MLSNFRELLKALDKAMLGTNKNPDLCGHWMPKVKALLPTCPVLIVNHEDLMISTLIDSSKVTEIQYMTESQQYKLDRLQRVEPKGLPFEMFAVITVGNEQDAILNIKAILCCELAPDSWFVLHLAEDNQGNNKIDLSYRTESDSIIQGINRLFATETKLELESTSKALNMKTVSRRLRHEAKHIVYLGSKTQYTKHYPTQVDRILNESRLAHLVRGHWRRLINEQRVGKNRHNEPIMNGYTWVTPHKRGHGEIEHNTIYVK